MIKRESSIHITKSDFIEILTELGSKTPVEDANIIFRMARAHSIHTRTITVSTERMEKKARNLVQSSRRDADLLAQLIYAKRHLLKHRGISLVKVGSRDWGMLKKITAHALDFTNEFNLQRRYGFTKYIEVGLSKMKKFNLNKFIPMYQGICETYQAILEIEEDDDSEMTEEMYKIHCQKVVSKAGVPVPLKEMPEKYVWFVRARQQAKQMNVSVGIYMESQFAGFDFTDGIPHPTQLVGPKAIERLVRYCYKEGIKIKSNGV